MRILAVDPSSFTAHYDANLCHALAERGHDVTLDTSELLFEHVPPLGGYAVRNRFFRIFDRRPALASSPPVRKAIKAAVYPFEIARWGRDVQSTLPDVVHLQWSLLPFWDSRVLRRIQARGAAVVYTVHNVEPLPGGAWTGVGNSSLYRNVDALIVHSSFSKRRLIADFALDHERIHAVPLGGPGSYAPPAVAQSEARDRLGLSADAVYLLFFGLIKPHKGLDMLLDALALVLPERPDVRLLIAGEPMQSWRAYARQIDRLGLAGAVDLRLKYVPSDELALYFSAADLVVLPYRETYQSMVAVTAYTFHRPVLATSVGGLPEMVEEGVTGFIAPPDARGLARVLSDAAADPGVLRSMQPAAESRVRELHSWDRIAARHEEIYEAIRRR